MSLHVGSVCAPAATLPIAPPRPWRWPPRPRPMRWRTAIEQKGYQNGAREKFTKSSIRWAYMTEIGQCLEHTLFGSLFVDSGFGTLYNIRVTRIDKLLPSRYLALVPNAFKVSNQSRVCILNRVGEKRPAHETAPGSPPKHDTVQKPLHG